MREVIDLGVDVPAWLEEELLKRLAYVSRGIRNPCLASGGRTVTVELEEGFAANSQEIAAAIADVARSLTRARRMAGSRTIARRDERPSTFSDDPHQVLESRGDIISLGQGRYAFGPRMVDLLARLDRAILDISREFAAPKYAFPALIGADLLDQCQYFRNFPTALSFVSHLREDHASIRSFAREAVWSDGHLSFDTARLSPVDCLLAPSVCFHWYACLAGTTLDAKTITAAGKCFRYESANLAGLERLWDFTMREIVFAGPAAYVLAQRDACIRHGVALLERLGLAYEVTTATDPFFADVYAAQAAYQQGFELKYELLAPLPYSGRTLAVGSINYHQDFFGRSFGIQAQGAAAHTGCIGFGLERLALAFLAQHGFDEAAWPLEMHA